MFGSLVLDFVSDARLGQGGVLFYLKKLLKKVFLEVEQGLQNQNHNYELLNTGRIFTLAHTIRIDQHVSEERVEADQD